jgi:hypothetical protein
VNGDLMLRELPFLENLAALSNLKRVGQTLVLDSLISLGSLSDLDELSSVGSITMSELPLQQCEADQLAARLGVTCRCTGLASGGACD